MGIDVRNQTKKLGKKETGKGKTCEQRIAIIKKTKEFRKAYMRTGTNNVLRMGVVPGRVWGSEVLGMGPSQRENLQRQLASAAGKKPSAVLSLFMQPRN